MMNNMGIIKYIVAIFVAVAISYVLFVKMNQWHLNKNKNDNRGKFTLIVWLIWFVALTIVDVVLLLFGYKDPVFWEGVAISAVVAIAPAIGGYLWYSKKTRKDDENEKTSNP